MNINVYDKSLQRVLIVENRFVSCLWSEGYNTTEPFTLELQDSEENKQKIRPGYFVGRDDRKTLMVITTVEARDGKIVATGKQAKLLLDDVSFVGKIPAGQSIDTAVINAYNQSSKCVDVDFLQTDLGVTYDAEVENTSILAVAETMCQSKDVGFRVVKNGTRLQAELYKPTGENPYRMSTGFGNVDINAVVLSVGNLKNYAIVLGTDANDRTVRVDVDQSNGDDRREVVVSAGETPKDGESLAQFKERLRSIGAEELLKRRRTWTVDFQPRGNDFGTKYDLGDIVVVFLPDYGLRFETRVTRFRQIEQNNSVKTTISIGEITILRRTK